MRKLLSTFFTKLPHIHWYKAVGDWTGYIGVKRCRCGDTKEFDIR